MFTAIWSVYWVQIVSFGLIQNSLSNSYLLITTSKRLVMHGCTWHSCQNWMSELNSDNFVHYLGQERVLSNLSGDLIVTLQFCIPTFNLENNNLQNSQTLLCFIHSATAVNSKMKTWTAIAMNTLQYKHLYLFLPLLFPN